MENTTILNTIPIVENQQKKTVHECARVEIITPREVNTTLLTRAWILLASLVLMAATCFLIAYLHIYKIFKKLKIPDPFHDSRKHPLNDPHAPRG